MACSTTPLSCLDPVNIFAGVYNSRCGGFADPSNYQAEKAIFGSGFQELINNYGVEMNYYVNGFNLSAMNILYGEHPTQQYSKPYVIKAYLELKESISLASFGMTSDDELTAHIAIKDFTNLFPVSAFSMNGQRVEPKSDDLLEITALGCDRPGNRGSKIFRVTQVLDQDVAAGMNPVLGHYTYRLTCKRFEYNHATNAPVEKGNDQVYDNIFSGKLSSVLFPSLTSEQKVYPFDIDTISQQDVYDMSKNDTSIYGTYY
jgi:hypothetical protein